MSARPTWRSLAGLLALVVLVSMGSDWWAKRHQRTVGEELALRANAGDIQLLSSDTCAPCVAARTWLQRHSVAFSECSIERDAACKTLFEASQAPGTPVLLVRGQVQVGFKPERLLQSLPPRS